MAGSKENIVALFTKSVNGTRSLAATPCHPKSSICVVTEIFGGIVLIKTATSGGSLLPNVAMTILVSIRNPCPIHYGFVQDVLVTHLPYPEEEYLRNRPSYICRTEPFPWVIPV